MWVLIDHYDSFTYLIRDGLWQLGHPCTVYAHDRIALEDLIGMNPERIILSPGPKTPAEAPLCRQVIEHFHSRIPLLGLCLGHQALGCFFGAGLGPGLRPMHGRITPMVHHGHPVFAGVPARFPATRYHSLILKDTEKASFQVICHSEEGEPMALAHPEYPVLGL